MNERRESWLRLTSEEPIDREREIVDAHHHLHDATRQQYLLEDLLADTRSGHNVTHTICCEAGAAYRKDGPEEFRPVGEVEFVAEQARHSDLAQTRVSGIVAFADLTNDRVDDVLDAHEAASAGRLRGIRQRLAWDAAPDVPSSRDIPRDLMEYEDFRRGVAKLGARGYVFDAYVYHPQLAALADLALAVDDTGVVVDHLGMPLNVGPYTDRDETRALWRSGLRSLAACSNVTVKLGGIGMDQLSVRTGWATRPRPPGSDEVAEYWRADVEWCIDTFGPHRCMFESNFPVDRATVSYTVLWNAFKKIAAGYTDAEQRQLFAGTASRVYNIETGIGLGT